MSAATAVLMLQRSGFTQEQVEALAEFNASQVDLAQFATKADLALVRSEVSELKTELLSKIDLLEQWMTIKLGTMIAAAVTLVTVAVKPL